MCTCLCGMCVSGSGVASSEIAQQAQSGGVEMGRNDKANREREKVLKNE